MSALPASARRLPDPWLNVVLVEPQIPPNTGNVARLCAATGCHLILVGALGFDLSDSALKRAGLDYWEHVSWEHHPHLPDFLAQRAPQTFHLLTAHATVPYTHMPVVRGDYVLFGKETAGLPAWALERFAQQCYGIPMPGAGVRSLNLSSATAVVVYDALRRLGAF